MEKIQCVYDRDNNFFFHLMSVAKVGYDNAYGEKYDYITENMDSVKAEINESEKYEFNDMLYEYLSEEQVSNSTFGKRLLIASTHTRYAFAACSKPSPAESAL